MQVCAWPVSRLLPGILQSPALLMCPADRFYQAAATLQQQLKLNEEGLALTLKRCAQSDLFQRNPDLVSTVLKFMLLCLVKKSFCIWAAKLSLWSQHGRRLVLFAILISYEYTRMTLLQVCCACSIVSMAAPW